MKFQNPYFKKKLNGRTHGLTDGRTDKPKAICSPLFQSWGHKNEGTFYLAYDDNKAFLRLRTIEDI